MIQGIKNTKEYLALIKRLWSGPEVRNTLETRQGKAQTIYTNEGRKHRWKQSGIRGDVQCNDFYVTQSVDYLSGDKGK